MEPDYDKLIKELDLAYFYDSESMTVYELDLAVRGILKHYFEQFEKEVLERAASLNVDKCRYGT